MCRIILQHLAKQVKSPKLNKKGFTILELGIVIIFICILVYLLKPVVKHMHVIMRQQKCLNNLKEVSLALRIYAFENKEYMPRSLTELSEKGYLHEKYLVCPFKKDQMQGYAYKNKLKFNSKEDVPLVYDKKENHPDDKINVLYLNGDIINMARWPSS